MARSDFNTARVKASAAKREHEGELRESKKPQKDYRLSVSSSFTQFSATIDTLRSSSTSALRHLRAERSMRNKLEKSDGTAQDKVADLQQRLADRGHDLLAAKAHIAVAAGEEAGRREQPQRRGRDGGLQGRG
eukprot:3912208-Pleurochrysis_carterae.AAC.2